MTASVCMNGMYSKTFAVTRGTKQGSIISPKMFNIFLNDLITELDSSVWGVNLDGLNFNSFAYADDITVFSATATGLQNLINICHDYAKKWRFSFGIKKTKCMIINKKIFKSEPSLYLGKDKIDIENDLEILGTIFSNDLSPNAHIQKRTKACRQTMYGLAEIGCSYPGGLATDVKLHLWKTMGQPVLTSGLETIPLSGKHLNTLESIQGSILKKILGFPKRSHHSRLVLACNTKPMSHIIKQNTLSLWQRIFRVDSPARTLCAQRLAKYILTGCYTPNTLIARVLRCNVPLVKCLFQADRDACHTQRDGVVDSIRYLIMNEQFLKPYSDEHTLAILLTKAF